MRLKTPIIKDYFCIDIEDIDSWEPVDREYVHFWLDIYVGFDDSEYSDNYQLHVVTEKQLSQIDEKKYLLVIPYYENIKQVLNEIAKTLGKCKDIKWFRASHQVAKHYFWEYQDYK